MLSAAPKILLLCALLLGGSSFVSPTFARGELSRKQARRLIAGMAGFALPVGAVRVTAMRSVDASTAEATAEIAMVFRFERNQNNQWRVAEFRSAPNQWQSIELLANSLKVTPGVGNCDQAELARKAEIDPSNRRARCLLAELLGVQLPSDAVRIKEIGSPVLPLGSKASVVIDSLIGAEFRFSKNPGESWRVAGVRTGSRAWLDPETVLNALNSEKAREARAELQEIASALEDFRNRRGSYVEARSQRVLLDFLSPRYLSRVIRLDPWHRPYFYEGTRDQFTLRSAGPDGKENTGDDIVVSKAARSAAIRPHS